MGRELESIGVIFNRKYKCTCRIRIASWAV